MQTNFRCLCHDLIELDSAILCGQEPLLFLGGVHLSSFNCADDGILSSHQGGLLDEKCDLLSDLFKSQFWIVDWHELLEKLFDFVQAKSVLEVVACLLNHRIDFLQLHDVAHLKVDRLDQASVDFVQEWDTIVEHVVWFCQRGNLILKRFRVSLLL